LTVVRLYASTPRSDCAAYDPLVEERLERQARNEALLREVNERINAIDRAAATGNGSTHGFHCECGRDGGCEERIWMTLDEYDLVRAQDDRFALAPGHETDRIEHVVERSERYVVVDKVDAAEHLVADDPRGRPSY
jgi:hypothetical protein